MKTKLKLIIALLCLLTCSIGGNAATSSDSVYVSTYNEFIDAVKANKRYIRLKADINMTNFVSPVDKFTGEINGLDVQGTDSTVFCYTLRNLHESLAVSMEGAFIHDIRFASSTPEWHWSSINEGMGVICRNSKKCTFENIRIDSVKVYYNGFWKGSIVNPIRHYNGGIAVGKDNGSTFNNMLISNSYVYVSSTEGGGVVGDSYNSTFEDITIMSTCAVHVKGSENLADANAGGIAGRAEGCKFCNCQNYAMVTAALDNVGGIVGKATKNCTIENSSNYAFVGHKKISSVNQIDILTNSYNLGAISSIGYNLGPEISTLKENADALANFTKRYNKWHLERENYLHDWKSLDHARLRIINKKFANMPISAEEEQELTDIRKSLRKLKNPGSDPPEEPFLEKTKTNPYCELLGYVLMAAQIAQMVYEAQDEDDAGGIAGRIDGGSITGCANYGMVYCDDAFSGGIAGETSGSAVIRYCHNAGTVQGYEQTGGIVGKVDGGTLANCLNTGNINNGNSSNSTFGMIYGEKTGGATISHNCYIGRKDSQSNDCRSVSQKTVASGAVAQYMNNNGETYWRQTVGTDFYPTLDTLSAVVTEINNNVDTVFHVNNALQLMEACTNQYANVVVEQDIACNSHLFGLSSNYMPFYGTIDGKNHTISNISYTLSSNQDAQLYKNDNHESRAAFFRYARNASFKNLTFDNIQVTIGGGNANHVSLLVADSKGCTYENIHITGTSKIGDRNNGFTDNVAGLVSKSENDTFTDCSTGTSCSFNNLSGRIGTFYTRPVGGLVARAKNSKFLRCHNAATLKGEQTDYAGGIVAWDEGGSTLTACLNTGAVTAEEYVGGIIGCGTSSKIIDCVNTGDVKSTDTEHNAGGIIGEMKNKASMKSCFNYGKIIDSGSTNNSGVLVGIRNDGTVADDCLYYCNANGSQKSNADNIIEKLKSGEFAYNSTLKTNSNDTTTWYQAIDANYNFPTRYPVPVLGAGHVYQDVLCDASRTITYSNRYHADQYHATTVSNIGVCSLCGNLAKAPATDAVTEISTADDLVDFATIVGKSETYSALSARMKNDIDLDGVEFPTIGTESYPYKGTFDGGNHYIRNMALTAVDSKSCGLFSYLGDGAEIDSLIIDHTCSIQGNGKGVAGIAGATKTSNNGAVTIRNCANNADITGEKNVAGILGGVYNNTTNITISNCYNTGTITGTAESASICAWAKDRYSISNCFNIGTVGTIESGKPLYRFSSNANGTVSNCYDVTGSQTGVAQLTTEQIISGELCWKLNGSDNSKATQNGFYQRLDTIANYPTFTVNQNDIVRAVNKTYCDNSNEAAYYNTGRPHPDYTKTFHRYDTNGFCTTVANETHYEEPDNVMYGKTPTYLMTNAGNLYWLAEQVNTGMSHPNCVLMNDIVVNENVQQSVTNNTTSNLRTWTPIGVEGHAYQNATFDGCGHTISGLYYHNETADAIGLFGLAYNTVTIKNLGVTDCYFNGRNAIGAIVGWGGKSYNETSTWNDATGPSLFNCYASGQVTGKEYVGGLMGFANNGDQTKYRIYLCYSKARVTVDWNNTDSSHEGPLFGELHTSNGEKYSGNLDNCYYDTENANDAPSEAKNLFHGTGMTSQQFASGLVCDLLNQAQKEDTIFWSQDLATQEAPIHGKGGVKLTRSVNQKWGTVILPYTVYSDSTITYFVVDTIMKPAGSDIASLYLKRADQVSANTPCFFYNSQNAEQVVFRSDSRNLKIENYNLFNKTKTLANNEGDMTFTGTYNHAQVLGDNQYVLTCDSAMWNKSCIIAANVTVEPYHAYISSLTGRLVNAKQINVTIDGDDFDFNKDGVFNADDISFVNDVLAGKTESENVYDANQDGKFSMGDVSFMIQKRLDPNRIVITPPFSTGTIKGK